MSRSKNILRSPSQTYLAIESQSTFLEPQLRLRGTTGKGIPRIVTWSNIWILERLLWEQWKGRVVGDPKIEQGDHLRGYFESPDEKRWGQEDDNVAEKLACSTTELNPTQGLLGAHVGLVTQYVCYNIVPKGNFMDGCRDCTLCIKMGIYVWHELA